MKANIGILKTVLLWVLLASCPIMYAQNTLSLMFTGVDQNSRYVRINSVTIENLTRGWSETILFPDTIYTMEVGTSVEDYSEEGKMQVMPNPFDGHTRVNISSAQSESAKMVLVDINGKKCAEYAGNLVRGDNYFEISLTTPQVYVLSVTTSSGTRSLKMVNKGNAGADRILSDGNTEKYAKVDLKSALAHDFELGDEMCYKGFASHNGHQIQSEGVTQQQIVSETFELRFNLEWEEALTVQTDSMVNIPQGLRCYGTVLSGEGVTARGFCWSTTPHPTLANDYTVEVGDLGSFSSQLIGLDVNQCYFLRSYATNNDGTSYGNEFQCCFINNVYTIIDTFLIPDGLPCYDGQLQIDQPQYCSYVSPITITDHPIYSRIESANDILYVRLKIEHSFIGDLWIRLTCPNQQYVSILKKNASGGNSTCSSQIPASEWGWNGTGNAGAYFGGAYDYSASGDAACNPNIYQNQMGTPWNYCWSNATNQGYVYSNNYYVYVNAVSSQPIDSTNVANMTNVYHPDGSFANLIGCPMNGTWSIEVMDGWNNDNGWITEWELVLDTAMVEHTGDIFLSVDTILPEMSAPCQNVAVVTDYDGNVYNTVQIGNQCWLRENLRTTHYVSGDPISLGSEVGPDIAHYYLPEDVDNDHSLGYLYNWKAVMGQGSGSAVNPSGVQGICPTGWHVPSDAEWAQLTDYMSGLAGYVCGENPSNIAYSLAADDNYWHTSDNPCAVGFDLMSNNISGFSAMPAGYANGSSLDYRSSAMFWTATPYDDSHAHYRALHYDNGFVEQNRFGNKAYGMSVRCIMAETPKVTTAAVTDVLEHSAVCGGEVTSIGGAPVTERGICWSTSPYPTVINNRVVCGSGSGAFTGQMTGLTHNTTYYVRAYATNAAGTVYGSQKTFTTLYIPEVETHEVTNIMDNTALCGGVVISDGGTMVTARGVCWSASPNPTLADSHTTDGAGLGDFSSQLVGLIPATTYYVRAYATNSSGTAYGDQQTFTTLTVPSVITNAVTHIMDNSAVCGGHIISNGGENITQCGVCWSTSPNPTLSDSHTVNTNGETSFSNVLTNLQPQTSYYVRAYASNSVGVGYGDEVIFTTRLAGDAYPCLGTPTVTDFDGNVYNTVQIGDQCWMRENLRTTHYADGTAIPNGGNVPSNTDPYYYVNTSLDLAVYGCYYNWLAAMHGSLGSNAIPSGVQGICPVGWHLPSDAEWSQLTNYVSGQSAYSCTANSNYIAKSLASTEGWLNCDGECYPGDQSYDGNNASGFSASPSGFWGSGSHNAGYQADFWSSTEQGLDAAWYRTLFNNNENVSRFNIPRTFGMSVRCLRD